LPGSQLGTGVRDFFYEPAEGLMQSPSAFGRGVAKGTLSLVGHTTSGVLGFTTKVRTRSQMVVRRSH
jgi:Vacuolar-sorting-associated 13 protein C-terminal